MDAEHAFPIDIATSSSDLSRMRVVRAEHPVIREVDVVHATSLLVQRAPSHRGLDAQVLGDPIAVER